MDQDYTWCGHRLLPGDPICRNFRTREEHCLDCCRVVCGGGSSQRPLLDEIKYLRKELEQLKERQPEKTVQMVPLYIQESKVVRPSRKQESKVVQPLNELGNNNSLNKKTDKPLPVGRRYHISLEKEE